jgi:hypothetical protein
MKPSSAKEKHKDLIRYLHNKMINVVSIRSDGRDVFVETCRDNLAKIQNIKTIETTSGSYLKLSVDKSAYKTAVVEYSYIKKPKKTNSVTIGYKTVLVVFSLLLLVVLNFIKYKMQSAD